MIEICNICNEPYTRGQSILHKCGVPGDARLAELEKWQQEALPLLVDLMTLYMDSDSEEAKTCHRLIEVLDIAQ